VCSNPTSTAIDLRWCGTRPGAHRLDDVRYLSFRLTKPQSLMPHSGKPMSWRTRAGSVVPGQECAGRGRNRAAHAALTCACQVTPAPARQGVLPSGWQAQTIGLPERAVALRKRHSAIRGASTANRCAIRPARKERALTPKRLSWVSSVPIVGDEIWKTCRPVAAPVASATSNSVTGSTICTLPCGVHATCNIARQSRVSNGSQQS
jgi:hypothetical protein